MTPVVYTCISFGSRVPGRRAWLFQQKSTAAILVLLLIFLLAPRTLTAQWSRDPSVNTPVCLAPGTKYFATTVPDGSHGVHIIWVDERVSSQRPNIY